MYVQDGKFEKLAIYKINQSKFVDEARAIGGKSNIYYKIGVVNGHKSDLYRFEVFLLFYKVMFHG